METLTEVRNHWVEKGWHIGNQKSGIGYLENFYDKVFPPLRENCKALLEIGVWHGGSLDLWRAYFPDETEIYGIDNLPENVLYRSEVEGHHLEGDEIKGATLIVGDAYSDEVVNQLQDNYFDIIIDDGNHAYTSWEILIVKYYPKLKTGGIMIIEDLMSTLDIGSTERESLKAKAEEVGFSSVEEHDMSGFANGAHFDNNPMLQGETFILKLEK